MIEIIYSIKKEFIETTKKFSDLDWKNLTTSVGDVIFPRFAGLARQYSTGIVNENDVSIVVEGITLISDEKSITHLMGELAHLLSSTPLDQILRFEKIDFRNKIFDIIFSSEVFPNANYNEKIMAAYKIEAKKIPPDFICPITQTIMFEPGYLLTNPKIHYEAGALKKWLDEKQTDPTTRAPVIGRKIIRSNQFKLKIANFVCDAILGRDLEKYATPTKEVSCGTEEMEKKSSKEKQTPVHLTTQGFFAENINSNSSSSSSSTLPGTAALAANSSSILSNTTVATASASIQSTSSPFSALSSLNMKPDILNLYGKAFRKAAANNRSETIEKLYAESKALGLADSVLNKQDENLNKTPLHLAVAKNKFDAVKMLHRLGAKWDIPDDKGETALNHLQKSTSAELHREFDHLLQCSLHTNASMIKNVI